MNHLFFNSSAGYQNQSFFDCDNKAQKNVMAMTLEDCDNGVQTETPEMGFTDAVVKDLAEEISNKLIIIVKNHLEK